ncbi:MetQ/NlpA family ABC transporter substrate-binding protein [Xylophilus sp. GW821-FHT01B05]
MNLLTTLRAGAAALVLLAGAAWAQAPLRIGVTPGPLADSAEIAAAEARKQGLDVKVVEFSDWTTPNTALAAGDLDANYFQHQAYLDNAIKERGYKFRSVAVGLRGSLGLFSARYRRTEDIPAGARIALSNDPANQTRALAFLRDVGLLTLRPGTGRSFTLDDVAGNPRKLKFVEVPGPQLVRSFEDVDAVVTPPSAFVTAGRKDVAAAGLRYSIDEDSYWAIQFVARNDNAADPRLAKFIAIYQASPAVRKQLHESYGSNENFYSLAWLKRAAP